MFTAKTDDGIAYCVQIDQVTTDKVELFDIAARLTGNVPSGRQLRRYEKNLSASNGGGP